MWQLLRVALAVLMAGVAGQSRALEPPGLLAFAGQPVKWGTGSFGSGADVTYALLEVPRSQPGARNCAEMLPLAVLLDRSKVAPVAFARELAAAFNVWEEAADIAFRRVADPGRANIVVGAQAGTRGVAFTNVERDRRVTKGIQPLTGASICLDPSERWEVRADGDPETYALRHVLAHEIGHAIGLDHYGPRGGLMGFAYIEEQRGELELALSALDRAAVTRLYGPFPQLPVLAVRSQDADACDVRGAITPARCLDATRATTSVPAAAR